MLQRCGTSTCRGSFLNGTEPINQWLDAYQAAWSTDDANAVAALFTEDARYFATPFADPHIGRDAIAKWWVEQGESAMTWAFEGEVIASTERRHVIRGTTKYADGLTTLGAAETFHNIWIVTLEENGEASEFVEYWMLEQ